MEEIQAKEEIRTSHELVTAYTLPESACVDPEIVKKAMQGDNSAFSTLFIQTYRSMYAVVRRFLTREEDIYDALQNGYTKAYKYLPRLRAPEAFTVWLQKTMESAAQDIRTDLARQEMLCADMEDFSDELATDCLESVEHRADIREVLSRLDPQQANVLTLYYYDGLKLSEIARMLGEPSSTVRSRFARAKRKLVEQLKEKGIDKSLYGGSVTAMIAVSLRSLIGTNILSAATAQRMLDDILAGRQERLDAAAYKLLETQRNRTILRAVSWLMALTVAVTCTTVAMINGFPWKWFHASTVPGQSDPFSDSGAEISAGAESDIPPDSDPAAPSDAEPQPDIPAASDVSDAPAASAGTPNGSGTAFVPDYAPGQANTEGNSSNNVCANSGNIAKQGDWIYYSVGSNSSVLMKMKTDGSQRQMIVESNNGCNCLNVLGDWIYFIGGGIWRIRTDGSGKELISALNVSRLRIIGDTGYFYTTLSAQFNTYTFYTIDLNTRKTTELKSFQQKITVDGVEITSNTIFAVDHDRMLYLEGNTLTVLNLKTNETYTLGECDGRSILTDEELVYYVLHEQVYSCKYTDPAAKPQLVNNNAVIDSLWFLSPYNGGILGCDPLNVAGGSSVTGLGYLPLGTSSASAAWYDLPEYVANGRGSYIFADEEEYVYLFSVYGQLIRMRADGAEYHSFS